MDAKALEKFDPYQQTSRALDYALPLTRIGRALFHLSQRRGFTSNRKFDRGTKTYKEASKVREAAVVRKTQKGDFHVDVNTQPPRTAPTLVP